LFSFEGPQGDELAELNANATVVEKEFGLGNPGTCPMGEVAALVTSGLWKTANISDMAKQGACFI
jgi:hypothetical protein